jgi:hypothetical protein
MKKLPILLTLLLCAKITLADEGMWLPQLLQSLNEKQMKKMGMKISATDIYNINKASLKDAIVSFGGFCTAEVISNEGLLLTNHHCGFDAIQNHSSLQNNYIRDGFWAYNKTQEIPNAGLTATFIINITEVTGQVLANVNNNLTEKERQSQIDKNIAALKPTIKKETYQEVVVRPFFDGNKYFLFITETYKDVRLVGAPPSAIGNFGKDTDNWMWPRHTGDFSMFRIYANKNNNPAEYAADNVPYKPKRALNISLKGVKENDFTMVFGFPGRTTQYLPSTAVTQITDVLNPAKINIRAKALSVIDNFMRQDEGIKIKYAAKYANIQNAYKKWQGEVLGLQSKNAVSKKKEIESVFEKIVLARPEMTAAYLNLLKKLEQTHTQIQPYALARDNYNEITQKIELVAITNLLRNIAASFDTNGEKGYQTAKTAILGNLETLFAEYDANVDQSLFEALIPMYQQNNKKENVAPFLNTLLQANPINVVAQNIYQQSNFTSLQKIKTLLNGNPVNVVTSIKADVAYQLITDMRATYSNTIADSLAILQNQLNSLQRQYMQAQLDVFSDKAFYPDANGTLRVTYGQVKGYQPKNGASYHFYTYLDGVLEKYKPNDYEFDVPQKLIQLYQTKNFGRYGVNGKQPVCFIAANHTTGGNSGSPALDANGNLVGLNFDRAWEGTMSDINYDPSICRNIMVDIRYVMFIVDKFAGATNLIKEIKFVQ